MNEKHDFNAFARARLDETLDGMDGAERTRLAAIRRQALASGQRRRGWWLPASLATAVAALMLVWMLPQQQTNSDMDVAAIADLDLLASDVDLDLLEDVEFYQWLDEANHAG